MKKRVISGLLAVMMLLTTAFAAGGSAAEAEGQSGSTVLSYAVTLPDEYDTDQMHDAVVEQVRAVLEHRLEQLNIAGAEIAFPEDRQTVVVTLPTDTETDSVAEFLAWRNELAFTDADGKVWLTGENVSESSLGFADDETPYIQVNFTDEGEATFAEALDAASTLTVTMDGAEIAQATAESAGENGGCTLTGSFTEDEARLYIARIAARTLPVELTLTSTETQPGEPEQPVVPAFPDIEGHWAADALGRAVALGLLNGIDGKMLPDNAVKRSEAIVILNRALGADIADSTSGLTGTPQNAWYANDLGKAIHLGLIESNDSRNFDTAATRAEAFVLLARAFVYDRAEAAEDELSAFTDTGSMTDEQRQAAAALVAAGIVNGETATTLNPQGNLTRAQFVTMLLRIAPNFPVEGETAEAQPGGTLVNTAEYELADVQSADDYIFAADTTTVQIDGAALSGRVVLKGAEDVLLTAQGNTSIGTLAADPAGTAAINVKNGSGVQTLVIAGKGGAVTFDGSVSNIEITASNREIDLSGMQADSLTVTGSGNTITVGDAVGTVSVMGGAKNNTLTINDNVDTLLAAGVGTKVDGSGKAGTVDVRAVNCEITLAADTVTENIDKGLDGVAIEMGVPTKVLPGGSLLTQVKFTGVTEEKICSAQWYQDGKPIAGFGNDNFQLTADKISRHTTYFTFTKDMKTSVTMGFKLTYDNPSTGETEELYVEKTVPIENYSDEWYYERDVNRVLNLVSSTYRGNYTTAYAVNGDYSKTEKEIWINAKGYSSNSQYLVWINRAYQHVNVFQGSKGNWKMIKSFLVGTGAASTPTPVGVTTVSYKLASGWTTSTYTVRPVVGFYPGTGYAFHSRLCYPGTDTEYDYSAGYPVSHGCIRMYKSDINWIYNNIPVGTTVVIF